MSQNPYDLMTKLAPPGGDGYGIYGDEDGLYLGPRVPLVTRQIDATGVARFTVRPQHELSALLNAAYEVEVDLSRCMSILQAVANALEKGQMSRAMISAAHLRLPPLCDDAAVARLLTAERMLKYNFNPDEPRDWHGRWTYASGWSSTQAPQQDKSGPANEDNGITTDTISFSNEGTNSPPKNSTTDPKAKIPADIPPGVSIDKNIRQAERGRTEGEKWFYDQVRNHGPWDYKQRGRQYQDFGNFNFGATGAAFGFSESTLLRMAGWAQVRAHTSNPAWGEATNLLFAYLGFGGKPPYGDDPNDQYWIKQGILYYKQKHHLR